MAVSLHLKQLIDHVNIELVVDEVRGVEVVLLLKVLNLLTQALVDIILDLVFLEVFLVVLDGFFYEFEQLLLSKVGRQVLLLFRGL